MTKEEFLNRLRALNFIDRHQLPELSNSQWESFRDFPYKFFIRADEVCSNAIWRELERQHTLSLISRAERKNQGFNQNEYGA